MYWSVHWHLSNCRQTPVMISDLRTQEQTQTNGDWMFKLFYLTNWTIRVQSNRMRCSVAWGGVAWSNCVVMAVASGPDVSPNLVMIPWAKQAGWEASRQVGKGISEYQGTGIDNKSLLKITEQKCSTYLMARSDTTVLVGKMIWQQGRKIPR